MKKKLIVGVTGGIAVYKVCDLVSLLKKKGFDVHVIMTKNACEFVTPLTFKTLSGNEVYNDEFAYDISKPIHIELIKDASLFIVAPATANLLGKLANGICDDILTTMLCAHRKKFLLAPAMNTNMWESPIVQKNILILKKELDVSVIEPDSGHLACDTIGKGRLPSVELIFNEIEKILQESSQKEKSKDLAGTKVLVTAGGTREPIDPVRFIGNRSSGKMGIAIADEAYTRGADVVLVTTASSIKKEYEVIEVETASQMQKAVEKNFDSCKYLVMAAAVSDYAPVQVSKSKIKKNNKADLELSLMKNPDILATLGLLKKSGQVLIGFAAESEDLLENAAEKLKNKNLDMIVANQINVPGIGFSSDENEVWILSKENKNNLKEKDRDKHRKVKKYFIPQTSKAQVAKEIWDYADELFGKDKNIL